MSLPTATYRLQLREGMDFARATELVPYWQALGVSHLYLSPPFTASTGSTHGYDVTDPSQIDPALGGREGLERLARALREAGLGLILDIVPNHTAFSLENPWLRDVLRRGEASRYARHFDIDWSRRLVLPMLTEPFEALAAAGAFSVEDDEDGPVLAVEGGLRVPLAECDELAAAREAPHAAQLRALHAAQPWHLTAWQVQADAITHRRFFSITSLIGMRVEDEQVFEDTHALIFELVEAGLVDGLRIDHIDGLADPLQYLHRLKARLPGTPIWVEKILSGDEELPQGWDIAGTTGYVAARAIAQVLTDAHGASQLQADWWDVTGRDADFRAVVRAAKRRVLETELAAELWGLQALARPHLAADPVGQEIGPETLREAVIALVVAMPRYRSYLAGDDGPEPDRALIREVVAAAQEGRHAPLTHALEVLGRALIAPEGADFARRYQQITGAAQAKAQEDTAFYRWVPLLSANEVGAEPDEPALDPAAFGEVMHRRAEVMPQGLTLTSSHDTKRSEDARARLMALSHHAGDFARFFAETEEIPGEDVDPNLRWYLAQSLMALPWDAPERGERLRAHLEKAMREAKEVTGWIHPDSAAEGAAQDWLGRVLYTLTEPPEALATIEQTSRRLVMIQAALKLMIPGIPDIYQGSEIGFFALTDPDNRRAVSFDRLREALDDPGVLDSDLDRDKLALTRMLLGLRREERDLFAEGDVRVDEAGEGVLAFSRTHSGRHLTLLAAPVLIPALEPVALPEGRVIWGEGAVRDGQVHLGEVPLVLILS